MKKFTPLLFLVFCILFSKANFAQCPGCAINTTLVAPGIYPDTLPNGTQAQPYSEDVTFVMFTDTSGFAVNYFKIVSVTGLPFGLNWQCNNSANGCQYDPSVSIHGCVKICGTPLQSGHFIIEVGLLTNLAVVGNVNSVIPIVVDIDAAAGGNAGFSFSPAQSCDTALVSFTSLISGAPNPTSYSWNFGNGNTSTSQTPPSQNYTSPGDYVVSLQTDILGYKITGVNVTGLNNNWCGDVEEASCTFNNPDPYFQIFNSLSNNLYTASSLSDVQSGAWSGLNILLNNPPYSITIMDDDNVSADDNLGNFPFSVSGAGTIPFSGAGGTSGTITVATYVIQSFLNYDTIHVYAPPTPGTVTYALNDSVCFGDSVLLTANGVGTDFIQWYNDTTLLVNENGINYTASQTGDYYFQLTNASGCSSLSAIQHVEIIPLPGPPTFLATGNTLNCFLTGVQLQWYLNGTAILGATGASYVITQNGNYSVVATDAFGCTNSSIVIPVTYSAIDDIDLLSNLVIYPNPTTDVFTVNAGNKIIGYTYVLSDNLDRQLEAGTFKELETQLSLQYVETGLYFLTVQGNASRTYKIIKK